MIIWTCGDWSKVPESCLVSLDPTFILWSAVMGFSWWSAYKASQFYWSHSIAFRFWVCQKDDDRMFISMRNTPCSSFHIIAAPFQGQGGVMFLTRTLIAMAELFGLRSSQGSILCFLFLPHAFHSPLLYVLVSCIVVATGAFMSDTLMNPKMKRCRYVLASHCLFEATS